MRSVNNIYRSDTQTKGWAVNVSGFMYGYVCNKGFSISRMLTTAIRT